MSQMRQGACYGLENPPTGLHKVEKFHLIDLSSGKYQCPECLLEWELDEDGQVQVNRKAWIRMLYEL